MPFDRDLVTRSVLYQNHSSLSKPVNFETNIGSSNHREVQAFRNSVINDHDMDSTMLEPMSYHNVSQMTAHYTEQIFDRPLDPSQQESVRSSCISQVTIVSADSDKIRQER